MIQKNQEVPRSSLVTLPLHWQSDKERFPFGIEETNIYGMFTLYYIQHQCFHKHYLTQINFEFFFF